MDVKKNYEMKLMDWNVNVQLDRYYFLLLIVFVLLFIANYYFVLLAHRTTSIVNLYAIVFSLKLFRFTLDSEDSVLKTQILQMLSLSILLIILSFIVVPLWIVVTLNNFFALIYLVFFQLHKKTFRVKYAKVKSFFSIVHFFFVVYLFLLNVQVYLTMRELIRFVLAVNYIQVGIQVLVLLISVFTYLYHQKFVSEVEQTTFGLSNLIDDQVVAKENEVREDELEEEKEVRENASYRLNYKYQVIGDQILEFFESERVFLQRDFTLEVLCTYIPNCTTQQLSFVINNHLNTTFYKLVAYYRIMYSMRLFANHSEWTQAAIAEECGFRSINTFNKYFKDLTGLSPVDYRGVIEKKG